MTTTKRFAGILVLFVAASTLLAGDSGNEIAIGNLFIKADLKITKATQSFVRTLPKTITTTVRKLEKADQKGKSVEQLTAIANSANSKLQLKSDKALSKVFAINDDTIERLTALEAQTDYFLALTFLFNESTTQIIQGTQDAIDAINTALANEIAD